VQPGQPGIGTCQLELDTAVDGGGGDHCLILCGPQTDCPAYFMPVTLMGTCVCVPPA
jgi:hypothetical protein